MEQKILEFINRIADQKGIVVERETDLFEDSILDSMEIITLLTYLQDEFQIEFAPEDLQYDNFQSVASILQWIESCQESTNEG